MKMLKKATILLIMAGILTSGTVMAKSAVEKHDNFYWLGQINKASLVINTDQGLIDKNEAPGFARGINKVLQDGDKPDGARPTNVVAMEPYLIAAAGPEFTKLHAGRSSQDMLSTVSYMRQREGLLDLATSMNKVNATLINMAEKHKDTIIPSYTNGVAAQPTSYGHYLLAFADGFGRDMERLQQYYKRVNLSAMGSTVLNGTSWPLNRQKMAEYLGFPTFAYNTYDANQIYTIENGVEAGYVATNLSLHVGDFIEDVMQQYAQPRPWIILKEGGKNTYVSSAMPQKRNPGILNSTRTEASTLLGASVGATFRAHNVPPGMADARSGILDILHLANKEMTDFNDCLQALQINPTRALEELNLDWTASQEVADVLMRKYGVPFRMGHHFASNIVTYARANQLTPKTFPYAQAQRIYAELMTQEGRPTALPMSEQEFKDTLDPVAIVHNRAVPGGPQPAEMQKMLGMAKRDLAANENWVAEQRAHLKAANDRLNADFNVFLQ
jgi:argininosuccinate lyase